MNLGKHMQLRYHVDVPKLETGTGTWHDIARRVYCMLSNDMTS